jgi:hypothetical protein
MPGVPGARALAAFQVKPVQTGFPGYVTSAGHSKAPRKDDGHGIFYFTMAGFASIKRPLYR